MHRLRVVAARWQSLRWRRRRRPAASFAAMAALSAAQKQQLFEAGYVVVPGRVDAALVSAARRAIFRGIGRSAHALAGSGAKPGSTVRNSTRGLGLESGAQGVAAAIAAARQLGGQPAVLDLFNRTAVASAVSDLLFSEDSGAPPPRGATPAAVGTVQVGRQQPGLRPAKFAQVATNYPSEPTLDYVGQPGFPDELVPFNGANLHLDGCWNGGTAPPQSRAISAAERAAWYGSVGTNGQLLEVLPAVSNIANSYTLLVGVPLSDQRETGQGNFAVLKGSHFAVEAAFQRQRAAGSVLGPEGLGWPREDPNSPTCHGVNMMPPSVRDAFAMNADGEAGIFVGRQWPKPTQVQCGIGDCIIALWSLPHAPTYVTGEEPRLMVFFRVTAERPRKERQCSPAALCDVWRELPGMRATVDATALPRHNSSAANKADAPALARAAPSAVIDSAADVLAVLRGDGGSWSLSEADYSMIQRLAALRALCFDTNRSELAAELYTEDAVAGPLNGRAEIARAYAKQAQLRAEGRFRLRSRHHVSNLVVKPTEVEGLVVGSYYLVNVSSRLRSVCLRPASQER